MTTCPTRGDDFDPDEGEMCSCEQDFWSGFYDGEKAAGFLRSPDAIADDQRLVKRGHLV